MTVMPKINKQLLFNTVKEAARRDGVQIQLFGKQKQRRRHLDRENLFNMTARKADELASQYAERRWEESGHRAGREKAHNMAYARVIAAAYTWPELFDRRRAFASQERAYRKVSVYPDTGKKEYYKGIDSALYGLFEAGLDTQQVSAITRELLFNNVLLIKEAQINEEYPASTAARLYGQEIEPKIAKLLPPELANDEEKMADIGHQLIFILYIGVRRELGDRRMEPFRQAKRERIQESARLKLLARRDMQEEMAKGVPAELLVDQFQLPLKEKNSEVYRL